MALLRSVLFTRHIRPPAEARARILNHSPAPTNPNINAGLKFLNKNLIGDKVLWYEKSHNEILSPEGLYEPTMEDVYWTKKKASLVARGKPPTRKHEGKKKSRRK
eukprot:TRINITY_DN2619_c0_g1_i1.p1 TRINITY_DN2619_c0_g1~~TRINITY_DN2619_c0_g1_i1.p1  ORF type:complete len:105 (-),score=27.11 TRINITY_DN2619_c0_g1_i1:31-345(-)